MPKAIKPAAAKPASGEGEKKKKPGLSSKSSIGRKKHDSKNKRMFLGRDKARYAKKMKVKGREDKKFVDRLKQINEKKEKQK